MNQNNRDEAADRYEDLFLLFSYRIEKIIAIVLLILLVLLVLSQLLLQHPSVRYLLVKVEQLEGNPYTTATSDLSHGG